MNDECRTEFPVGEALTVPESGSGEASPILF